MMEGLATEAWTVGDFVRHSGGFICVYLCLFSCDPSHQAHNYLNVKHIQDNHFPHNAGVEGSSPSLSTKFNRFILTR